eukprot:TRINITY_DN3050_c0_g1_i1.p1 TRINITY_DN3050_c0_g1~~TRINITY_DN3050_c0_g1_i1.p1  ORF type:complete len:286 (-),score=24.37 TRINITY_DN3050_c0_g1_i1:96-953(-)
MKGVLFFFFGLVFLSVVFSQSFDVNLAKRQLLYSYASYCPNATVESWTCYWCNYENIQDNLTVVATVYDYETDGFAYLGWIDTTIIIIFRGTVELSLKNWVTDLEFARLDPYPPNPTVAVHKGFYDGYLRLRDGLHAAFQQALTKCQHCDQVMFSGHSLGAALAELALVDLRKLSSLPFSIYTFGCPRVGNPSYVQYFTGLVNGQSFRLVNNADIVPHLPLESFGFHHNPLEVWIHNGDYIICDGTGEDPKCSDSLILLDINDHLSYFGYMLHNGIPHLCGGFWK